MNHSTEIQPQSRKNRIHTSSAAGTVLLFLGSIIMIFPFIYLFCTAFKPATELNGWPPKLLPHVWTVANFQNAFASAPFGNYLLNSFLMATISTLGILLTSSLAGYIFGKFHYKWLNVCFMIIFGTAIIPFEIYMIPLYLQMKDIGLINTLAGMVMPNLVMSFGVFFMRQTIIQQIPDELLEAARVEGASEWRIFFQVVLPLLHSSWAALGIFAFLEGWNAFVWPLLVANKKDLYNMELGLAMFQATFSVDVSLVAAGSMVSIIPILVVFLLARNQIMESIASTGLKG